MLTSVIAVAVLALAACGGDADPSGEASRTPAGPRVSSSAAASPSPPAVSQTFSLPSTAPPSTPPPSRELVPITIAFAGDVHFEGGLATRLDDPETALGPMRETLAAADLAMVNLETAITTRGEPQPKEFRFRAPPSAMTALLAAGVDW